MSSTAASAAPSLAPGSHLVEADGLRWHVEIGGAGPVVLLLHGTGGATSEWHDVAARLVPHCTVIVPDLPGHGRTSLPVSISELTLERFTRGVAALCTAIGHAPEVVVGHSAGAAVALSLAANGRMPTLRHVVGVNAALLAPPYTEIPPCAALVRATFGAPLALDLVTRLAARPGTIRRLLSSAGGDVSPAIVARYETLFRDPTHAAAAYGMTVHWRLAPLLAQFPSLGTPCTFMVGTDDRWTPPRVSERAAARLPHATVVRLVGAGHLAPEERPAEVAATILDAVRARDVRASSASPAPDATRSTF